MSAKRPLWAPDPRKRKLAIKDLALRIHGEHILAGRPVYEALAQVGGRFVPDLVRIGGRWQLAGEFEEIPKRYLAIPKAREEAEGEGQTRIAGNVDELADMAGMPEDDFRAFLIRHPAPPTMKAALAEAEICYDATMSNETKTPAGRKRAQRDRARAEGRCIICCRVKVPEGVTTCPECGKRANEAQARRKMRRAADAIDDASLNGTPFD